MIFLLWILGVVGHLGIWATLFNQIHSTACPRATRKWTEIVILLAAILPLIGTGTFVLLDFLASPSTQWLGWREGLSWDRWLPMSSGWLHSLLTGYGAFCLLAGVVLTLRWAYRKSRSDRPAAVIDHHRETISIPQTMGKPKRELLHGSFARGLGYLPMNQVLQVAIERMTWRLDIPIIFDGLKICHLSDLHFTGLVDKAYFQGVVELSNRFQPDLVLITGDLLDQEDCIEWIAPVLGQMQSKSGNFFVLGNHDRRIKDRVRFLEEMEKQGFVHLSDGWVNLNFHGGELQLAGNELPWFSGAEKLPRPSNESKSSFKILLSHAPDQWGWAQHYGFDLMFAGHTHGGQIVFPLIGPIVAPSRFGVKYAAGTFQKGDMLMHVSRGISGDKPIRINCPPEIGLITVRSSGQSR